MSPRPTRPISNLRPNVPLDADDIVLRRVHFTGIATDHATGAPRPMSGQLNRKPDGISCVSLTELRQWELDVDAVVRDDDDWVFSLVVRDVGAACPNWSVVGDPWPDDCGLLDPDDEQLVAHSLVKGPELLGKSAFATALDRLTPAWTVIRAGKATPTH